MVLRRKVQVFLYRHNPSLEVCLLKRAVDETWQPITGGVERHEQIRAAAVREAWEEATVEAEPEPLGYTFTYEKKDGPGRGRYHETTFAARVAPDDEVELSDEHTAFEWLAPADAATRLQYDEQKKALDVLAQRYGRAA